MGLVDKMKEQISQTGGSRGKMLYVKDGTSRRVRFLQELDEGIELTFHDSFKLGVNALCLKETFGEPCLHCGNTDLRVRSMFAFLVYDYDAKEIKIFLYAANNCSPLPQLISFAEAYSTLCDRDYVIERRGTGMKTSYPCIPSDKAPMRQKFKLPTKDQVLKTIAKAYPQENDDTTKVEKLPVSNGFEGEAEADNSISSPYDKMTARQLYDECKVKGIEAETRQTKEHYIELLTPVVDEWGDDTDSDEWGDETSEADGNEWS